MQKDAGWQLGILIREWIDKEDALKQIDGNEVEYQLYTDSSAIDGMVGASAVFYRRGVETSKLQYHLGKECDHEAFEAECVDPRLGLELLKQQKHVVKVSLWIDNTSAILATGSNIPGPAHCSLSDG